MLSLRDSTNEAIENTLNLPATSKAKINIIRRNTNINNPKQEKDNSMIENTTITEEPVSQNNQSDKGREKEDEESDEVEAKIEAKLNRLLQETQEETEHDEVIPISPEELRRLFNQPQPIVNIPSFEETVEKAKKVNTKEEAKEVQDLMVNYTEEEKIVISDILRQRLYVFIIKKMAEAITGISKTYTKSFLLV